MRLALGESSTKAAMKRRPLMSFSADDGVFRVALSGRQTIQKLTATTLEDAAKEADEQLSLGRMGATLTDGETPGPQPRPGVAPARETGA